MNRNMSPIILKLAVKAEIFEYIVSFAVYCFQTFKTTPYIYISFTSTSYTNLKPNAVHRNRHHIQNFSY